MRPLFFSLLFAGLLLSALARADVATNSSTSTFDFRKFADYVNFSYGMRLSGPYVHRLDGNLDGRGTNLHVRNFLNLDIELGDDWMIISGWEFRRFWRPAKKNKKRPTFEARDPFLGFSKGDIIKAGIFRLDGNLKYSLPASRYTRAQIGEVYDYGRGQATLGIEPSLRFFDGDLKFSLNTEIYYSFAKDPPPIREDYSFKSKPQLAYKIHRKITAKGSYSTGTIRHATNGKWSKLNDPGSGHELSAGMVFKPLDSLELNPFLTWGPQTFRLNRGEVALAATYQFL